MATTISAEMVVPVVLGYWIDRWLGITAVFALLGGALGMTAGIWGLIRMANTLQKDQARNRGTGNRPKKQ